MGGSRTTRRRRSGPRCARLLAAVVGLAGAIFLAGVAAAAEFADDVRAISSRRGSQPSPSGPFAAPPLPGSAPAPAYLVAPAQHLSGAEPYEILPAPPPWSSSPPEPTALHASPGAWLPADAEQSAALRDRVLDLQGDRQTRRLVENVRAAVEESTIGVDPREQDWVVVDGTRITWGGRIHGDFVNWANDADFGGEPNYFAFRRLRLSAEAEGYGVFDYKLDVEFAPEIDAPPPTFSPEEFRGFGVEVKDAAIGIRDLPLLGYLRLGQFKTPMNMEFLTSSNHNLFLERAAVSRLAPRRKVGAAAASYAVDESIAWSYGVFLNDVDDNAHASEGDSQGVVLVGRVCAAPWYDELSDGRYYSHVGLSWAFTRPSSQLTDDGAVIRPVRFDGRSGVHRSPDFIDTGVLDASGHHVVNVEWAWNHGSLSLHSELAWASIATRGGEVLDLYGAYLSGSWFLTGEHRPYDRREGTFQRIRPHASFWSADTTEGRFTSWGAWEAAARWSYLDYSPIDGQQLHELTLGVNWYWHSHARMMFNWVHPWARHSPTAVVGNAQADILAVRFQVDF